MSEQKELKLADFLPTPKLVVAEHAVDKPRYPVIDAHNHLGWRKASLPQGGDLLKVMDEAGVQMIVDLTNAWDEELQAHLDTYQNAYPDRFSVFACVDWAHWANEPQFGKWAAKSLADSAARGARGFKIFKSFGLLVKDDQDKLVAVDDDRLTPLWDQAAKSELPVLIHVADPAAFFDPLDRHNERYEELTRHPDWHFLGPQYPPFQKILDDFARLVERNPHTTFIGAHVGCYPENLGFAAQMMDRCPNYVIDMSARVAELGRQPYTARRFFVKYADRILFGTDETPDVAGYRIHYRFLEMADEHFSYTTHEPPTQGRWRIYGIHLPDEVLAKVYYKNAARLLKLKTRSWRKP
jgi:predicted TIM-barrel fold metal-dependent hydrolase